MGAPVSKSLMTRLVELRAVSGKRSDTAWRFTEATKKKARFSSCLWPFIAVRDAVSGLAHAFFNVEPAVIAFQSLGLDVLAAGLEFRLVLTPVGTHFLQAFLCQFDF